VNSKLNAFCTMTADTALDGRRRAEQAIARGETLGRSTASVHGQGSDA
jgi:hypothetical protein